jgi:hypothetical protein
MKFELQFIPFPRGSMSQIRELPNHFPIGTRYVIEGRAGHPVARYIELPDGRHIDLRSEPARPHGRSQRRSRRRSGARK